jgi:MYXO-CTERM domain-containing protein
VDAATLESGAVVLAHRDEPGWDLRLSERALDGAWRTRTVPRFGPEWGQVPSIVPGENGAFRVFHGLRPGTSDSGLVRTAVSAAGAIASEVISGADAVGGALSAGHFVEGEAVLARELRRSALFGANDGLQIYDEAGRDTLASHSAAEQRRKYQFINARRDPFGLPVLAVYDERSPFAGQQAGAFVCLWRPTDTDFDRIPDSEEARLGTLPAVADTDGDGVPDGIEYLVDRTDPTGPGDLPPVDAGVLPDVGVGMDAFEPPADAGPAPDQGPAPDAARPDQSLPPLDRGPDPDAVADRGPLDANLSDAAADADLSGDLGRDLGRDLGVDPDDGIEPDRGSAADATAADATADMGSSGDASTLDAGLQRDAHAPRPDAELPRDFGYVDARVRPADSGPGEDLAPGASGCASWPDSAPGTGGGPLAWALLILGGLTRRRRAGT